MCEFLRTSRPLNNTVGSTDPPAAEDRAMSILSSWLFVVSAILSRCLLTDKCL